MSLNIEIHQTPWTLLFISINGVIKNNESIGFTFYRQLLNYCGYSNTYLDILFHIYHFFFTIFVLVDIVNTWEEVFEGSFCNGHYVSYRSKLLQMGQKIYGLLSLQHKRWSFFGIGSIKCDGLDCGWDTSDHHQLQAEVYPWTLYLVSIDMGTWVILLIVRLFKFYFLFTAVCN